MNNKFKQTRVDQITDKENKENEFEPITQRLDTVEKMVKQTDDVTQSANQHMHTFNFIFIKTYLKFLKTLLHVSVIRPSSGSL